MASFVVFDGKDRAPVSMAGGKGREGRAAQMERLRQQRAQRDEEKRREGAAVNIQKWVRGTLARSSVERDVLGRLQGKHAIRELLLLFCCLRRPEIRAAHFDTVWHSIRSEPESFATAAEMASEPSTYVHRCRVLMQTAISAAHPSLPQVLSFVLGPRSEASFSADPAMRSRFCERLVAMGVLGAMRGKEVDAKVLGGLLLPAPHTAFTEGALKEYVQHFLAGSVTKDVVTPPHAHGEVDALAHFVGIPRPQSISNVSVLQHLRDACLSLPRDAERLLLEFSRRAERYLLDVIRGGGGGAAEIDLVASALRGLVTCVSPGWMAKNWRQLAIADAQFGRNLFRLVCRSNEAEGVSIGVVAGLYAQLLLKCKDTEIRPAILAVVAFHETLLPLIWREVLAPRMQPRPTALPIAELHAETGSADFAEALYVWLLSLGLRVDCLNVTEQLGMFLAPKDVVALLINYALRMILTEDGAADPRPSGVRPPDAAMKANVSSSLISLLRKLRDWDQRMPFLEQKDWIANPPPFPWPERVGLDDWRANLKGSPIYRTYLVLQNIPFIIPFDLRVRMFRNLVDDDIDTLGANRYWSSGGGDQRIRRAHVFEDGFRVMGRMTAEELKTKARVTFISRQGVEEAGFGDGVFKEFLSELSKIAFDPDHGLFLETSSNELYPNPASSEEHLYGEGYTERFKFLGRVLGKALYEGILVELPLARFLRNSLLGGTNCLHDLPSLDPDLHRHLLQLKELPEDQVEDMGLVFAASTESMGVRRTVPFLKGGEDIPVTADNRMTYVHMHSHFKLTSQIARQVAAMREGLLEVVSQEWLRMFDANEVQILISGHDSSAPLDIDDWEENTVYGGGYAPDHRTIQLFWQVVRELSPAQQRSLLKFSTSVERAPLLGFGYLHPKFCIHMGGDVERLPSASTCMCLLKLPMYANKPRIREKLTVAIEHATGFEMS